MLIWELSFKMYINIISTCAPQKKMLQLTLLPGALCQQCSIFKAMISAQIWQGPPNTFTIIHKKFYINSEWENDHLSYYGKNLLKIHIWKSFHHFSNKWASDRGLFIFIYTYTQSHMCVCAGTYTHTYIYTPCLRNLKQNSLDAFKMFHILSVIWTHLLKT